MVLPPARTPEPAKFTRFVATKSSTQLEIPLTKALALNDDDGSINKTSQPNFINGTAVTVEIQDLLELPGVLDALKSNECIATGIFDIPDCLIVPKKSATEQPTTRSRSKESMTQPTPGLVLLDYDPNSYMPADLVCESAEAVMEKIAAAIPEFATIGYVGAGSCSSGVYREATGEKYLGGGIHVYIVLNSNDLDALKDYLEVKLWNAGLGYIALAKNGARLKRTIVDLSVLSQERLIYEAAPILGKGLAREPRKWTTKDGPALTLDFTITEAERVACKLEMDSAMDEADVVKQSDETYAKYRQAKVAALVELKGITSYEAEALVSNHSIDEREAQSLTLTDNDVVEIQGKQMLISELLAGGEEFNGTSMPDPIEGSAYGTTTAKFYYNEGRNPCIHSFAHGKKTVYTLSGKNPFSPVPVPVLSLETPEPVDPPTYPHLRVNAKGEISLLSTLHNVDHMLRSYGIDVRYNVMSKKLMITIPGSCGSTDNALNVAMNKIVSLAALNRMSTGQIPNYVATIADQNLFNPAGDWIQSMPWDGKDRIQDVINTLKTIEGYPEQLKFALVFRWLLSAVAAALMPSGFYARGVLTLQGPQGIGKTSWIRSLIPLPMLRDTAILLGHHLDAGNKDSIITAVSHWIVELGELDSSFKKDVARLKGFITGTSDKVRRPYAMVDSEYQRRTVFCATVNEQNFLVDTTGNSRWWTLPVTEINYDHGIDMQQVYAQLAVDFDKGEQWWLTAEEEEWLAENNRQHLAVNVIEEKMLGSFNWDLADDEWQNLSATQVLKSIGYDKPSNPQCKECGGVLRQHFGEPKKIQGIMKWRVPMPKPPGAAIANGTVTF